MKRSKRCAITFCVAAWALCPMGSSGIYAEDGTSATQLQKKAVNTGQKIRPYPNTPVWHDRNRAVREYPDYRFIGEYKRADKALQVTPAGGRFYLSVFSGGLPGDGWSGGPVAHRWVEPDKMREALQGWTKVDRSKSLVGKKPSEDAIVLFAGQDTSAWQNAKVEDGYLKPGCRTKRKFRDFRLYLEFQVPLKPEPPLSHPHRGNSGVFALGAYEVQISDTFALDPDPRAWREMAMLKPADTWCGSIYGIRPPQLNMCLPPLKWQSLEIKFSAARFQDGTKVASAVMSVTHNGVLVHDKVELPRGTGGGPAGPRPEVAEGPIVLQDHGNPNRFRNFWLQEL